MTLFNIVGEYKELYDMLTEADPDQEELQVILDTLEAVEGELEEKASGYVFIIKQLEMEAAKCKELADEWKAKQAARENAQKRLKTALKDAMVHLNLNELKAGDYVLKVQNNGGLLPLVYDHEEDIPQSLMKVRYEPDGKLIREYLEKHPEATFAHIGERGQHIAIK